MRTWRRWVESKAFNFYEHVSRMMLRKFSFGVFRLKDGVELTRLPNRFCAFHTSTSDDEVRATWLLHRDIFHALNMPVVQLYRRAASLAQAALCTNKSEDLELAFSGDSRSAFVWLQCFLGEEEEWSCTRGW
jgi:hypothetical protein